MKVIGQYNGGNDVVSDKLFGGFPRIPQQFDMTHQGVATSISQRHGEEVRTTLFAIAAITNHSASVFPGCGLRPYPGYNSLLL